MNAAAIRGRAFVPPQSLGPGATLTLDAAESHYIVRVRRAQVGDRIEVLDGVANKHAADIVQADASACVIDVGPALLDPAPPPMVVLMGIVDAKAVAEALAGASEVGVTHLVPVRTARAQTAMPPVARIARICRAAQRQCGRARPLAVGATLGWPDALAHAQALPGWVALPHAEPRPIVADRAGSRLLVGPEGGLTDAEVTLSRDRGFQPLWLGPHVLRTPTAVISGVARLVLGPTGA